MSEPFIRTSGSYAALAKIRKISIVGKIKTHLTSYQVICSFLCSTTWRYGTGMNNSLLIGGLIGVALWGFGVWKAAQLWSPPFLFDAPKNIKKKEKNGSIIPKLFWFCNGLLLIAAVTRMTLPKEMFRPVWMPALILGEIGALGLTIHMENTAKVTRNLIRLSAVGYKGFLYWTPAFWIFEKPVQIFCAAFLFAE